MFSYSRHDVSHRCLFVAGLILLILATSSQFFGLALAQEADSPTPKIEVIKTASSTTASIGDVVVYSYAIVNTGDVSLTNLTLVDDKLGTITLNTTTLGTGLSPNGSNPIPTTSAPLPSIITATASVVVTHDMGESILNVATVTGTTSAGIQVTDTATETVTITQPTRGVTGVLYHDLNGNGRLNLNDPLLPNVTMILTNTNGIVMTTTTGANGSYFFVDPPLGDYTVSIDTSTLPDDKQAIPSPTFSVTLVEDNIIFADRLMVYQPTGAISGQLFSFMKDDSGQVGDVPLKDITMVLYDTAGEEISRTVTNENGFYLFDDLILGEYTIEVDASTLPINKQKHPETSPDNGRGDPHSALIVLTVDEPTMDMQNFKYRAPLSVGMSQLNVNRNMSWLKVSLSMIVMMSLFSVTMRQRPTP